MILMQNAEETNYKDLLQLITMRMFAFLSPLTKVSSICRADKKMERLMTGVGDGCDSCLIPRSLWTDPETIEEGFPRDRTLESNKATWASLKKRRDGEVFKVTGDYETRQGLCHEPKTLRQPTSFTVTHKVS